MEKWIKLMLLIVPLFALSCSDNKIVGEIPVIDVTENYPEKNIDLYEIGQAEYIPLETKDGFIIDEIFSSILGSDKDGNYIIVNKNQGDVLFFDKTGKAVKKFNRRGKSGEEYNDIWQVSYDRSSDEILINSLFEGNVKVYDTDGNFIRKIDLPRQSVFEAVVPSNAGGIMYYDRRNELYPPLIIRSSQDSTVIKKVVMPYKNRMTAYIEKITKDPKTGIVYGETYGYGNDPRIIPYKDIFIVNEASCDTIYEVNSVGDLKPMLVRIPSLTSMEVPICLWVDYRSNDYIFMTARKKAWENNAMESKSLIYDVRERAVYEGYLSNPDMSSSKKPRFVNFENGHPVHYDYLSAIRAKEGFERGSYKGKLKDVMETIDIDEEDNPILIVYRFD